MHELDVHIERRRFRARSARVTGLLSTLLLFGATFFGVTGAGADAGPIRQRMRAIPPDAKFTVASDIDKSSGSPNPKGWYYSVANVVSTDSGLVAVYRRSDSHTCITSDIMVAYSGDKGRTWTGHHSISHKDVYRDHGVWVAPQLSRLRDGRLVIIADLGHRSPSKGWPMLAHWQKADRGMSNHLFWSRDNGKTWDGPHKIDDIGGEPGYVVELSDGTLVYTRTESRETESLWNPPLPWGKIYYANVAVFSDDGGKTWERTSVLSDSPYHGDCEVGIVEMEPGHLMAATRIGFGNGQFGQPSRLIHSYDNGRTWKHSWKDAELAPFYGQRNIIRKLESENLLVTYRNRWGTLGSYAFIFSPDEKPGFQPSSFIWDESRVALVGDVMTISSGEGTEKAVDFSLYPAQAPSTRVEIEAELKVEEAGVNGCTISAGCWIHFQPNRVFLGDRPEDGFEIDASEWHSYRIVRAEGRISIFVDGRKRLDKATDGIETRLVHFGNRTGRYVSNSSLSRWRLISARVDNKDDYSIDWKWNARDGYPDQFHRDRMVALDYSADSGYSGWAQTPDGTIVILDYTNEQIRNATWQHAPQPLMRSYVTTEDTLRGTR